MMGIRLQSKINLNILFFIIFCVSILSEGNARRPYTPIIDDPLLEKWRWVKFAQLSSKGVRCITEGDAGIMWFGLDHGVISYNGSEWQEYNKSNGFSDGAVRTLCITDAGNLIAGSDSGIYRFDQNQWSCLFSAQSLSTFFVNTIIQVNSGTILCGSSIGLIWITTDKIILYTSQAVKETITLTGFEIRSVPEIMVTKGSFNVANIYADAEGKIWLAAGYDNGYAGKVAQIKINASGKLDIQFIHLFSEDPNALFYNGADITQTKDQRIWIINNQHDQGLLRYDNGRFERIFLGKNFGEDEITTSIIETKDGVLFIGAMGKLYTYKNNQWSIYRTPDIPLPSSTRILVYESSDGSLWIAGKQNEVYKFDYSTTNWATYRHLNFEGETIDGDQWFISVEGRAVVRQGANWLSYGPEDGLIESPVRIYITRSGMIWAAGSHNKLAASAYLEGNRWMMQTYPSLSWNIDYRTVFEDKDSSLWFGGNVDINVAKGQLGGTVVIKNPQMEPTDYIQYTTDQKEPSVYGMGQSMDGQMWLTGIGTCTLTDNVWKVIESPVELKAHADYMCSSDAGELWIGSRNYGVFRFDGSQWQNYTIADGLESNSITFILPESESCIWVATDKGLSKFDGRSWTNNVLPSKLTIIREGGSLRKSSSGALWINKSSREWNRRILSGLNNLTPKMKEYWTVYYKPDTDPPQTTISIFEKQVYQPGNTIISWKGLDPWSRTPENKLQFSYRIDSGEWSNYSYMTNNIFLSLPHGDHIFEVRSRDMDYNIDPTPARIEFNVAPPFYLQPLFYIPMIILALIIIALQIRIVIRGRKLRAAKRETDNILHNVKEGLFLIDQNSLIGTQYSMILEEILEEESLAQKDLQNILKDKIDQEALTTTNDFIDLLFKKDYDQDMMDDLNPLSEIKVDFDLINKTKYLAFNFRNIESDHAAKKEVMVTVRDITEQVILERKLEESQEDARRQMDWLVSILHVEPAMLREFILSAGEELKVVEDMLSHDKSERYNPDTLKSIYRSVHLIKGNASLLALKVFSEQAHKFEDKISQVLQSDKIKKSDLNILRDELTKMKKTLNEVNNLLERIGKIHEQMRPRRSYEHQMLTQSLETLVKQTGKEQGKKVSLNFKHFRIEELPHEERFFIKEIMVQLIRNSIAHGIETVQERKKSNKPSQSEIIINTFKSNERYGFTVKDDGRGIQLEKLKQKALESKKWKKEEIATWDNLKLTNLIFEQGISTTENTDMISGRGVGLDLVQERVNSRDGNIEVRFEPGKFCEFTVSFPQKVKSVSH